MTWCRATGEKTANKQFLGKRALIKNKNKKCTNLKQNAENERWIRIWNRFYNRNKNEYWHCAHRIKLQKQWRAKNNEIVTVKWKMHRTVSKVGPDESRPTNFTRNKDFKFNKHGTTSIFFCKNWFIFFPQSSLSLDIYVIVTLLCSGWVSCTFYCDVTLCLWWRHF